MTPGTLLSDTHFPFQDGAYGKKILVVLSDGSSYPFIVVRTTSQQKNRGTTFGCQNKDRFPNFFLPEHSCALHKNTWIQLEDFREFSPATLFKKSLDGELVQIAKLPLEITLLLLRCAIESNDITFGQIEVLERMLQIYEK